MNLLDVYRLFFFRRVVYRKRITCVRKRIEFVREMYFYFNYFLADTTRKKSWLIAFEYLYLFWLFKNFKNQRQTYADVSSSEQCPSKRESSLPSTHIRLAQTVTDIYIICLTPKSIYVTLRSLQHANQEGDGDNIITVQETMRRAGSDVRQLAVSNEESSRQSVNL